MFTFVGVKGSINRLAYSTDGAYLATASVDCTVKVWDSATGKELVTLTHQPAQISSVAYSPDGHQIAASTVEGIVGLYFTNVDNLSNLARSRITRRLTPAECDKYLHASCQSQP